MRVSSVVINITPRFEIERFYLAPVLHYKGQIISAKFEKRRSRTFPQSTFRWINRIEEEISTEHGVIHTTVPTAGGTIKGAVSDQLISVVNAGYGNDTL